MTSMEKQCFGRLVEQGSCYSELKAFMLDEGILHKADLPLLVVSNNKSLYLANKLDEAKESGKIQLMSFEWTVLPSENINLLIITDRTNKTFTFTHF